EPGRAARPPMAPGARIRETCADAQIDVDVPRTIAGDRPLTLGSRELSLEELAAAAHAADRIPVDDENERARDVDVPAAGADLLLQRLRDPFVQRVGRAIAVNELGVDRGGDRQHGRHTCDFAELRSDSNGSHGMRSVLDVEPPNLV